VFLIFSLVGCSNTTPQKSNSLHKDEQTKNDLSSYTKIAQNIKCKDYETAIKLCNEITIVSQEGKNIVLEALTEVLNSQMKSTLTSFCSASDLIDDRTIDKFKQYKIIVDKMQVTEDDYTNVVKYINLILSTEQYVKYDPLWCLIKDVETDFNNAITYFDRIKTSYAESTKKSHATQARTAYQSCYTTSLRYNTSDFGISKTREAFKYYVDELTNFINYGEFAGNSKLSSEWGSVMDEAESKWRELVDILDKLPTTLYYGE
jgi:hypothetical protein